MLNRRVPFHGLLAVLLALMAQLGISATVPRLDPLTQIIGAEILCHASDGAGDTPAPAPFIRSTVWFARSASPYTRRQ